MEKGPPLAPENFELWAPQASPDSARIRAREKFSAIARQIGPAYAEFGWHQWKFYGKDEFQQLQRAAVAATRSYADQFVEHLKAGRNAIWSGTKGTGKDAMMCIVIRTIMLKHGIDAHWQNGMTLLAMFRETQRFNANVTERQLVHSLAQVPILAISDLLPPVGALRDDEMQFAQQLFDRRYRQRLPTLLTLNVADGAELASRLGSQVADRLTENCVSIPCEWETYRQYQGAGNCSN